MDKNKIIFILCFLITFGSLIFNLTAKETDFYNKLKAKKVNINFNNTDIDAVLKIFSEKMGINIIRNNNVKAKITANLKDISVIDALDIICKTHNLNYLIEPEITGENIIRIYNQQDFETQGLIHQGSVKIVKLKYNKAEDVYKRLMDALGGKSKEGAYGGGVIYPDKKNNSIIIIDRKERLENSNIESIIKAFDQPVPQVLIEAKILSVSLNKEHKYGIDWDFIWGGQVKMPFAGDATSAANIRKTWNFNIKNSKAVLSGLITALSEQGDVKILSNPRIVVLNNKEAKIIVGKNEPYTVTTIVPSGGESVVTTDTKFIEVGIGITVTPQINDGYITLKIKPNVSSAAERSSTDIPPTVTKSEAETMVVIKDKSTLVIGGLIETKQAKTIKRIPILGHIPLLGYLFSSHTYTTIRSEMVIFLTPTIISSGYSFSKDIKKLNKK